MAGLLFCACQKEDNNGELGGFWKITEIEDFATATTINTTEESRFWGIQLDLLEIRITEYNCHYCRFNQVGDSLFVHTIDDKTDLKDYGIYDNENERYEIIQLGDRRMVLRSKHAKVSFRKF